MEQSMEGWKPLDLLFRLSALCGIVATVDEVRCDCLKGNSPRERLDVSTGAVGTYILETPAYLMCYAWSPREPRSAAPVVTRMFDHFGT